MPHRIMTLAGVLTGLAGLAVLAALALTRGDVQSAARSGPRWRRTLVTAALALLAWIGLPALGKDMPAATPVAAAPSTQSAGELADAPEWKQITAAWAAAAKVSDAPGMEYDYSSADQKAILDNLGQAAANVAALVKAGRLTQAEADLLTTGMGELVVGVKDKMPTREGMLCYDRAMLQKAPISLARLAERLPLLEKFVAQKSISPAVRAQIVASFQADLAVLSNPKETQALKGGDIEKAAQLTHDVRAALEKISAPTTQPAVNLTDTPQWQRLVTVWPKADEVASGRKGAYPFDEAGQKALLNSLDDAALGVAALRTAGQLTDAEAGLLNKSLKELTVRVQDFRPIEMRGATCYRPMSAPPPAAASADRLAARLPMLVKLAEQKTISPAVAEKVLLAVASDLAILENKEKLGEIDKGKQIAALKTAADAKAATERIRALARK